MNDMNKIAEVLIGTDEEIDIGEYSIPELEALDELALCCDSCNYWFVASELDYQTCKKCLSVFE